MLNNKSTRRFKELVNEPNNKHTGMCLHDCYGFNFNKPFHIHDLETPFTINKVWKMLESEHNLSRYRSTAIILIKGFRLWVNEQYYIVRMTEKGFDIEIPNKHMYHRYDYRKKFDDFIVKYDFDDARKYSESKAVVIAQANEYITFPKEPEVNEFTRFTPSAVQKLNHTSGGWSYVDTDKSGYCNFKLADRKNKARDIRERKNKAEFKAYDYTKDLSTIRTRLESLNVKMSDVLRNLHNPDKIRQFSRVLDGWNDSLHDGWWRYTRLLESISDNEIRSMDDYNSKITLINKYIDNATASLEEL